VRTLIAHRAPSRRGRSVSRRVVSAVTTAALIVVAGFALLTVVIPFALGAGTHTVLTGSMRPALEPGSLVAVRERDVDEIAVGDVVTYQLRPGEPAVVTHRVIGFQRGEDGMRLLTQGDANNAPDDPVLPVQVRGVVVYALPWLGYPNLLLTGTERSILVIILAVGIIGYGFVVLARDTLRIRRRRREAAPSAWAVLIVAGAAVVPLAAPAAPASAATTTDHLELSTDGRTWTTGVPVALFGGTVRLVPGDEAEATLWVRNAASDAAVASLALRWRPADASSPADTALASTLAVSIDGRAVTSDTAWASGRIPAGTVRAIPVGVALSTDAGDDTRGARVQLDAQAALRQDVAALPATGTAPLTPWAIVAAVAAATIGAVIRVRARPRPLR
jgi:signal peptidase I